VDGVADVLRATAARDRRRDEEPDDLALGGADLLADDGQLRRQPAQGECALGGVVVGQRDPIEAQLRRPRDQRLQARAAVR
jgi:hypothetical protein